MVRMMEVVFACSSAGGAFVLSLRVLGVGRGSLARSRRLGKNLVPRARGSMARQVMVLPEQREEEVLASAVHRVSCQLRHGEPSYLKNA